MWLVRVEEYVLSLPKKLNELSCLNVVRTNIQWRMQGKGSRQNTGKSKKRSRADAHSDHICHIVMYLYLYTLELLY